MAVELLHLLFILHFRKPSLSLSLSLSLFFFASLTRGLVPVVVA